MFKSRSKIFVDRAVQSALARRILAHWFAFFVLTGVVLLTVELVFGNSQMTMAQHFGVVWNKYAFVLILMLALMPTFLYDTMKLSHRFAGPIVRLQKSMKHLANGTPVPELKFRDNDFWRELTDDFNRVACRISQSSGQDGPAKAE